MSNTQAKLTWVDRFLLKLIKMSGGHLTLGVTMPSQETTVQKSPAPEPPAPPPAPREPTPMERLLEQALQPRQLFGHTYTPDQLQVLELYLPKHLVTCITELATQHKVDAASIVLAVFDNVSLGELTQHALRLRQARDLQESRKTT